MLAERGLLILLLLLVILPNLPAHAQIVPSPAFYAPSIIPPRYPPMSIPIVGHAPQMFPVSGIKHVLVVAVAFSDVPPTLSIDQIKSAWTGTVEAYYHELSFGKITIQSDIFGWYKLPYAEEHYGRDCRSINDADCSGVNQSWHIAVDTVPLLKNITFSNYDYVAFIHSGRGQETSGVNDDIWSVTYFGATVKTNSTTLTTFSIIPELEAPPYVPYGDWCVELAHQLGVPDLFNTSTGPYAGSTSLGMWELMDKGSWNGEGWKPAHMTAWPKIQLGFISGQTLTIASTGENTYTIDPTEIASNKTHAVKIFLNNTNQNEYYLVEVRALIGFDSVLPSSGILITYVDETLVNNKVHILDGHPNEPDLTDATWDVGQTFTDAPNGVSVKVLAKLGNSYQITVTRAGSAPANAAPTVSSNNSTMTNQIAIAGANLTVEIAKTMSAQERGLSGRPSLPIDHGMLFVFDHQDYWTFWMIDMKFPLDIIWFNSAHQVVYFVQNLPPCTPDNCPDYTPDSAAMYVLEVNAGFVAAHHITLGTNFTFIAPSTAQQNQNDNRITLSSVPSKRATHFSTL
ncbi:MAG TPA: M6 family metalloprotease domain-containing protein [Candidatus Acidoferrum sp.]|nr:M6 family metalloprotease domain-containing protein [Candidatus Acidoferrum sp.]